MDLLNFTDFLALTKPICKIETWLYFLLKYLEVEVAPIEKPRKLPHVILIRKFGSVGGISFDSCKKQIFTSYCHKIY